MDDKSGSLSVAQEKAVKMLLDSPYHIGYLENEGSKATIVRTSSITVDEFREFSRVRDVIDEEVLYYNDLFLMVATAHDNLTKAYDARVEAVNSSSNIVSARDDLVELNTHFVSFIANFGMYLSCVPKKITSKRDTILEVHRQATRDEYDTYFSYRLACALRNYSLHHSPPITGIKGSKSIYAAPEYEIYIKQSELLKDSQISKKLASDFVGSDSNYPVLETIDVAAACLSRVHWKTIKALMSEISEEIGLIKSISEPVTTQGRQPFVVEFRESKEGRSSIDARLHLIPAHILGIYDNASRY